MMIICFLKYGDDFDCAFVYFEHPTSSITYLFTQFKKRPA